MKKYLRNICIFILLLFLAGTVGYSSFLINVISNSEGSIINNTYNLIIHFENEDGSEEIIEYNILEEDSTFDLPLLSYENKVFNGRSLYKSRDISYDTTLNSSIKEIKQNFPDVDLSNNELNVYAIINDIDSETVLLAISGNAIEASSQTYFLKTNAGKFNVFNIKYIYPPHFVSVTFNNVRYDVNSTIDLSPYGGQQVNVIANQN